MSRSATVPTVPTGQTRQHDPPASTQDIEVVVTDEPRASAEDEDASSSSSSEDSTLKAPVSESGSISETAALAKSHATVYLNVETEEELKDFLRDMLEQFLEKVNPLDDRLLDVLLANHIVTHSDYDSFNGKHVHTPRDQARKLWLLLNNVPVEDFKSKVFPELVSSFPHIVPKKFCTTRKPEASSRGGGAKEGGGGGEGGGAAKTTTPRARGRFCLRHDLMTRARPASIADILFGCHCISLETYSDVTADCSRLSTTAIWSTLFAAFRDHEPAVARRLTQTIEKVLGHYRFPVPPDLPTLLARGAPCTCRLHPADLPPGSPPVMGLGEGDNMAVKDKGTSVPSSQDLGSEETGFDIEEVLSKLDPDFRGWAEGESLSDLTLRQLIKHDLTTKLDLLRLTPDRMQCYRAKFQLPVRQLSLLEDVVLRLQRSAVESERVSVPGLNALLSAEPARVLVVGKTGSGKSSTSNTLMGAPPGDRFHMSLSMVSETRMCQFERSDDRKLEVMDCPGLFDTDLSLEEVCTQIVNAVIGMCPGPSAVLYVLKIGDKYTEEEFGTYKRLKAIFGPEVTRHMIIVFTRGDELKKAGKTIEQYVQKTPSSFKTVLRECGNRYVVFDNTPDGLNIEQIQNLQSKMQEVSTSTGTAYYKLKYFSQQQGRVQEEVRRLLKKYRKEEFEVKKKLIDSEDGFWKTLWLEIWEALKKLARLLRFDWSPELKAETGTLADEDDRPKPAGTPK